MMPGIYPVALPRVNFAECGGLDTSELRAVAKSPKLCCRCAGAENEKPRDIGDVVRRLRNASPQVRLLGALFLFLCALVLALLPVLRQIKAFRVIPGAECCMIDFGK